MDQPCSLLVLNNNRGLDHSTALNVSISSSSLLAVQMLRRRTRRSA
jgi:hypothetical protein